jgi:hypothetical protein
MFEIGIFDGRKVPRKPRLVGGVKGNNIKGNYLTGKPHPKGRGASHCLCPSVVRPPGSPSLKGGMQARLRVNLEQAPAYRQGSREVNLSF